MATYDDWNTAIAQYFVSGVPKGTAVFLSMDDLAIAEIGRFSHSDLTADQHLRDFLNVIRSRCVSNNRVYLERIGEPVSDEIPPCVPFLGAMVLAAHRMAAEEDETDLISDINYFTRLRQVLGISDEGSGRPLGLTPAGVEVPLWDQWNRWLAQNGWLPSAERGEHLNDKFIHYPLSQALLREGDKEKLEQFFRKEEKAHGLSRRWDREQLGGWLRGEVRLPSTYLRKLVQETDPRRIQAVIEAFYEVYSTIEWDEDIATFKQRNSIVQRRLTAGLFRDERIIEGTVDYLIYPRQPKRYQGDVLQVIKDGNAYVLRDERPGWFYPLWAESPHGGVQYEVIGNSQVRELFLPERRFWIFIRDPEDPQSGVFGTWGIPEVGETFLLLCRKECVDQMVILKEEALLNWDHESASSHGSQEWIEYRECMVLSQNWEGVLPRDKELYDALKPNIIASLTLSGGLRAPQQGAWLEGYGPELRVNSFAYPLVLDVLDIDDPSDPIEEMSIRSNAIIENFKQHRAGTYMLRVYDHTGTKLISRRPLRIISWTELESTIPSESNSIKFQTFTLEGGIIRAN